jgi:hypothetical protein
LVFGKTTANGEDATKRAKKNKKKKKKKKKKKSHSEWGEIKYHNSALPHS